MVSGRVVSEYLVPPKNEQCVFSVYGNLLQQFMIRLFLVAKCICKDVIVGTRSHRQAWNARVHTELRTVCKSCRSCQSKVV